MTTLMAIDDNNNLPENKSANFKSVLPSSQTSEDI